MFTVCVQRVHLPFTLAFVPAGDICSNRRNLVRHRQALITVQSNHHATVHDIDQIDREFPSNRKRDRSCRALRQLRSRLRDFHQACVWQERPAADD